MIIRPSYVIYKKHEPVLSIQEIQTIITVMINSVPDLTPMMSMLLETFTDYAEAKNGKEIVTVMNTEDIIESINNTV